MNKKYSAMESRKQSYEEDMQIVDQIHTLVHYRLKKKASLQYKMLRDALRIYEMHLTDHYDRYRDINGRNTMREEMRELQQSLNRERTKREEIEDKVKEASESSGLFIKYVRSKLKM